MNRLLIHSRRALLGLAVASSLGFGATQAFARPSTIPLTYTCDATGYDYADPWCSSVCQIHGVRVGGYCSASGVCRCGYIP